VLTPSLDFRPPYCLLHRAGKTFYGKGVLRRCRLLAEVPRPGELPVISMVPYTQLRERGFVVHDGDEAILTLQCDEYREIPLDHALPDGESAISLVGAMRFNMGNDEFMAKVRAIVDDEIRAGEGANFLFSRKGFVQFDGFDTRTANTIFRRLAQSEMGAYMTFCFHDGQTCFIGSSPERHISIADGRVRMNPICGTLPKGAMRQRGDLIEFLSDPKEINELFQVVDEELKMMSKICRSGGDVIGPLLKEMSTLIHTEYLLEGETSLDVIDAFRLSMFAATMIGSPLENAARVIHKYETDSRRYYSSALLLMERDEHGRERLDSAITIRTMEVDADGLGTIQAGASIVRDSVPEKECLEIEAKAGSLVRALASERPRLPSLSDFLDGAAEQVLQARNQRLSRFWIEKQSRRHVSERLQTQRVLIIDNEDEFTHMLKHILEHLGMTVDVREYDDHDLERAGADIVLVGPGPGDPTNRRDPKMQKVHDVVQKLLESKARFLAVCLGHQVLCARLGMQIIKSDPPLQGVQKPIDLFGTQQDVGFYNTFFAVKPKAVLPGLEVAADADDGKVFALRAEHFVSFQFHVESVLTTHGLTILHDAVHWLSKPVGR
jgi:2-amino-4-deoxychorismate synthase